jgi:hypothetical protein
VNGTSGSDERRATAGTSQAVFDADAERFDKAFRAAGAIYVIHEHGEDWALIDATKVSADLLSTYRNFISYGYANGLMP